jgi:hypothetical protein
MSEFKGQKEQNPVTDERFGAAGELQLEGLTLYMLRKNSANAAGLKGRRFIRAKKFHTLSRGFISSELCGV